MPAWMSSALALLGRGATGAAAVIGAGELIGRIPGVSENGAGVFGEEKKRRRRRRRALTASDRADIAFITGLLGPGAGKNFALTIATRT